MATGVAGRTPHLPVVPHRGRAFGRLGNRKALNLKVDATLRPSLRISVSITSHAAQGRKRHLHDDGFGSVRRSLEPVRRSLLGLSRDHLSTLRPSLHRYCARMTGSVMDGEDVVQEALFEAYQKLEKV